MYWNDLNSRLKAEYGCKVYKLALSSGCSCPNRDGTLDTRGCIFCDGAGAFAEAGAIPDQLAAARLRVAAKAGTDAKYIAYFQSFTNTYGDADRLRALYQAAMAPEDVVILSIATRPDCLGPDILGLLEELNRIKPVWVELGLQTIHPESARYLRRGYDLPVFDRAVKDLKAIGVTVIVHQILGLPGETPEMMAETARYIGQSGAEGVKLHLLHVLRIHVLIELGCLLRAKRDHDGRCLLLSRQLFCSLRSGCPSGSCLAHSPSPSRSQLLTI